MPKILLLISSEFIRIVYPANNENNLNTICGILPDDSIHIDNIFDWHYDDIISPTFLNLSMIVSMLSAIIWIVCCTRRNIGLHNCISCCMNDPDGFICYMILILFMLMEIFIAVNVSIIGKLLSRTLLLPIAYNDFTRIQSGHFYDSILIGNCKIDGYFKYDDNNNLFFNGPAFIHKNDHLIAFITCEHRFNTCKLGFA